MESRRTARHAAPICCFNNPGNPNKTEAMINCRARAAELKLDGREDYRRRIQL